VVVGFFSCWVLVVYSFGLDLPFVCGGVCWRGFFCFARSIVLVVLFVGAVARCLVGYGLVGCASSFCFGCSVVIWWHA